MIFIHLEYCDSWLLERTTVNILFPLQFLTPKGLDSYPLNRGLGAMRHNTKTCFQTFSVNIESDLGRREQTFI